MAFTRMISSVVLFSLILSFPAVAIDKSPNPTIDGIPDDVQYPFIAKVTGNNVYVRSGKGTAYYACGKINLDDRVTVLGQEFGWAEIVPPEGSYSWIHKNYVDVDKNQPTVGVLTGDNVRVWAGSDSIEPMRSTSMQTKLNTGEIVELFPDQPEESDYYKIKAPAGAKLTINCAFLEYVGPAAPKPPVVIPPRSESQETPADLPASTETEAPVFGNLPKEDTASDDKPASDDDQAAVKETEGAQKEKSSKPDAEQSDNMKACYALSAKIDEEVQKPIAEQNYDAIKKEAEVIKADTSDSKASTFAEILLNRIAGIELAISVPDAVEKQDQSLAKAREKIEKAHQEELKSVHREADFIYTGVLKVSHVYTQKTGRKRYLLQDPDGKILCYAIPVSDEVAAQFESLLDKRVGIKGTVSSDTKSLVTVISATTVEPI